MDPMGYINVSLSPLFPKYVFWSISKPLIDSAKIVTLHSPTVSTNAMQLKGFLYFWWVQRSWGVTLENKSFWKLMEISCFGGVVILASIWGGGWWGERLFVNQVIIWSSKIRLDNHPPFKRCTSQKLIAGTWKSWFPLKFHAFLQTTINVKNPSFPGNYSFLKKRNLFFQVTSPPLQVKHFFRWPPFGWNSAHDDRNQLVSMPSQNLRGKARCLYHKLLS